MRNKAQCISLEAIFSLLLLISLLAFPLPASGNNLEGVYVLQRQHDLLKIWIRERNLSEDELKSDFLFVFPCQGGVIEMHGSKIVAGEKPCTGSSHKSVAAGHYLDGNLALQEIRLTVCY